MQVPQQEEIVQFDDINYPRFSTIQNVARCLICKSTINYHLLLQLLLFLPSVSSPLEFATVLINLFKEFENEKGAEKCLINILIVLRCWMRESFAHIDFNDKNVVKLLREFLEEISTSSLPAIVAAGKKIEGSLKCILDDHAQIEACLIKYNSDVDFVNNSIRESCDSRLVRIDDSFVSSREISDNSSRKSTTIPQQDLSSIAASDLLSRYPIRSDNYSTISSVEIDHQKLAESIPSFIQQYTFDQLAQIMTATELDGGLLTIRPREFVGLKWIHPTLKYVHPDLGGASHLRRLILVHDHKIAWIADEIINYGTTTGSVTDCIEYFLRVARSSLKINNYNAAFQIVSALCLPAIKHLSSAWNNLKASQTTLFENLKNLFDHKDNYANYRHHFDAAKGHPRIPCLSILLRDVTLLENSHPWKREECIDLQKVKSFFEVLQSNLFSLVSPLLGHPQYNVRLTDSSEGKDERPSRSFFLLSRSLKNSLFTHVGQLDAPREHAFSSFAIFSNITSVNYAEANTGILSNLLGFDKSKVSVSYDIEVDDTQISTFSEHINRINPDLNELWKRSKIVNDIENSRLIHRLIRAGLI